MKKKAACLLRLPPLLAVDRARLGCCGGVLSRIAGSLLDRLPEAPPAPSGASSSAPRSLPAAFLHRQTISSKLLSPVRLPLSTPFSTATPSRGPLAPQQGETEETEGEEWELDWEEEEETEPEIGDGGDGGGIVLGDVAWGERALSAAREILLQFGDDLVMYAFKVSPRGYIYVRLDKLTNEYGCPSIEEIENFNSLYKKQLDEIGDRGEIPSDLALQVSSPGAERLLKVPEDLDRFKQMPMWVHYLEEDDSSKHHQQKDGVFMLNLIDNKTGHCVWKLADVKENRAELGKGRPLTRKQKDWRLRLPFDKIKRVTLHLRSNH